MSSKIVQITSYLGLFLVISGISYYAFSSFLPVKNKDAVSENSTINTSGDIQTNPKTGSFAMYNGPKTEVCPINGEKFTKEEKAIWSTRRPLLVMIENHSDARPQSGLQNADIVYEAVAEGGITRFMGVFYCNAVKGSENKYDLGPVRSARTYFLDLASEYSDYPLYAHVGGSNCSAPKDPKTGKQSGPCTTNKKAQALEQIADYGWNNKGTWGDLSQFSLSYKVCRREPERTGDERATEHTMYCSSKELWNVAADRGLTNTTEIKNSSWDKNYKSWLFTQADKSQGTAATLSFDFWGDKAYAVSWKYDSVSNIYTRFNGGKEHIDFNTSKAITTKNIVIQFAKESRSIDEHVHNLYGLIGNGTGILFQNGQKTDITWSKANRTARTIFKDSTGKEVNFVPGQTWVEILAVGSEITYEAGN